MTDKQATLADLFAEGEDYTPQTEGSLQEQIARRRNPNWIYLTEDDVRTAKTFDNELYSVHYDADCDDLIETAKEEMYEENADVEIVFAYHIELKHPTVKFYEKEGNSELYLIIDGEDKFIFHGYDDRVVDMYNNLIIIAGKEQVTIYDIDKKILTQLR